MGIEVQSVRLMLLAREMGVDFTDTLTIGRQRMMVTEKQVAAGFGDFGEALPPEAIRAVAGVDDPFSDALFHRLGAGTVTALDYSDYEGATLIQDLNKPLDPATTRRFSVVFDGGTIEHVFNAPTALATLMQLPKVGGHLILALPANNEMGHGFYQFSPEFFFRTLTRENGYAIEGLFLAPLYSRMPWLVARDPAAVRTRVGHSAWSMPTYAFVVARRHDAVEPFVRTPQQSDYSADWEAAASDRTGMRTASPASGLRGAVRAVTPEAVLELARSARERLRRPDPRNLARFYPRKGAAARVADFYR